MSITKEELLKELQHLLQLENWNLESCSVDRPIIQRPKLSGLYAEYDPGNDMYIRIHLRELVDD